MKVGLGILLVMVFTVDALGEDPDLVDIYGSLRPELIVRTPEGGKRYAEWMTGYSRVGVKGATELRDELVGFYKYERRVSANDGQDDGAVRADNNELRQVHVGMRGKFGSVAIGRHYGLYYDFIDDELDRHRVTMPTRLCSVICSFRTRSGSIRMRWDPLFSVPSSN